MIQINVKNFHHANWKIERVYHCQPHVYTIGIIDMLQKNMQIVKLNSIVAIEK